MKQSVQEKAMLAVQALEREYPDAVCSLEYQVPHELLISTRLAAQCTDARVNIVTKDLFAKYRSVEDFANADIDDVKAIVKPCGFFNTKAKDIVNMCRKILEDYDGQVPDSIEELTKLPGVGRKTANLVVGDIFGKPAVVCDTHCIRITNLLGLTTTKDPGKCEKELRPVLPPEKSNDFCHRLVLHGRAVCKARRPDCGNCCMQEFCDYAQSRLLTVGQD